MQTTHLKKDFSYNEYLELLNQGKTKTEIIEHFGMARATFYRLLKEKEGTTGSGKKIVLRYRTKVQMFWII